MKRHFPGDFKPYRPHAKGIVARPIAKAAQCPAVAPLLHVISDMNEGIIIAMILRILLRV